MVEPKVGDVWMDEDGDATKVLEDFGNGRYAVSFLKSSGERNCCRLERECLIRLIERAGERVPEAPKLVRREIVGWNKDGRPLIHDNDGCGNMLVGCDAIHVYVYEYPDDPEIEFVSNRPSVLWDNKKKTRCMYTTSERIESGEVIRLLPVAAIVE